MRRTLLVAALSIAMLMSTASAASAVDLSPVGNLGQAVADVARTVVSIVTGAVSGG